jgi:hypothetical protein
VRARRLLQSARDMPRRQDRVAGRVAAHQGLRGSAPAGGGVDLPLKALWRRFGVPSAIPRAVAHRTLLRNRISVLSVARSPHGALSISSYSPPDARERSWNRVCVSGNSSSRSVSPVSRSAEDDDVLWLRPPQAPTGGSRSSPPTGRSRSGQVEEQGFAGRLARCARRAPLCPAPARRGYGSMTPPPVKGVARRMPAPARGASLAPSLSPKKAVSRVSLVLSAQSGFCRNAPASFGEPAIENRFRRFERAASLAITTLPPFPALLGVEVPIPDLGFCSESTR